MPEGVEGEVHIRSPYLMREYWRKPEATRETLLPGSWLRTGDVGHFQDGRLYDGRRYSYDDPSATVIAVSEDGPVTVLRHGKVLGRSPEQDGDGGE